MEEKMVNLILAILSSALISVLMRFSERYSKNNMGMFMANYAVCVVMSRVFMGETSLFTTEKGISLAVLLGIVSGVLYLGNFVMLQKNMHYNGVVLSATFMKLGVLVPTVMAVVIFREVPTWMQLAGIALALAAIIMIHFDGEESSGEERKSGKKIWLIVLLLLSGITDSMANIYDKTANAGLKDHYLLYTFFAAFVIALILGFRKKEAIRIWDVAFGILIGIPNYFSARFLLGALAEIAAVVVYPVYSVATIVVISAAGMLLFKEKISNRKKAALGLIMGALVLLNL